MAYMCKAENVANMVPKIQYKILTKTTSASKGDLDLELPTTRYQVIAVSDVTYKYFCLPVYSDVSGKWWVRVFNVDDFTAAKDKNVTVIVVYLDYQQALFTG